MLRMRLRQSKLRCCRPLVLLKRVPIANRGEEWEAEVRKVARRRSAAAASLIETSQSHRDPEPLLRSLWGEQCEDGRELEYGKFTRLTFESEELVRIRQSVIANFFPFGGGNDWRPEPKVWALCQRIGLETRRSLEVLSGDSRDEALRKIRSTLVTQLESALREDPVLAEQHMCVNAARPPEFPATARWNLKTHVGNDVSSERVRRSSIVSARRGRSLQSHREAEFPADGSISGAVPSAIHAPTPLTYPSAAAPSHQSHTGRHCDSDGTSGNEMGSRVSSASKTAIGAPAAAEEDEDLDDADDTSVTGSVATKLDGIARGKGSDDDIDDDSEAA